MVSVTLHVEAGTVLLFHGPATDCPPIPRTGDEVVHDTQRVRLEGIEYRYKDGDVEIALLA